MYSISKSIGQVVAADSQSSASALNSALIAQARLTATIAEASEASGLPMIATQSALESLAGAMSHVIESRAGLVSAARELATTQSRSNLRTTNFGCPTGPYQFFTTASAAETEPEVQPDSHEA
ncbi:MAG: hypothetical protein LC648_02490 [Novosphingobium sp.]|nr:hypothetical protein [Novosphingobium sp.]